MTATKLPPKAKRKFYVSLRKGRTDSANASCVAHDNDVVAEFFRDYKDHEIRLVSGEEMVRLMTTD